MTASELVHQPIALSPEPSRARQQVRDLLREIEWEGDADEVVLAVHEALVNAQTHAGAVLRAQVALEASSLVIMVWDTGPGFDLDLHARPPVDPLAERGRGLWLINRVTSACEVDRDDDGVVLVMRFDRH